MKLTIANQDLPRFGLERGTCWYQRPEFLAIHRVQNSNKLHAISQKKLLTTSCRCEIVVPVRFLFRPIIAYWHVTTRANSPWLSLSNTSVPLIRLSETLSQCLCKMRRWSHEIDQSTKARHALDLQPKKTESQIWPSCAKCLRARKQFQTTSETFLIVNQCRLYHVARPRSTNTRSVR